MIPRGVIDIEWSDLARACFECFKWRNALQAQSKLEAAWSPAGDGIACLSVRSGFDLLLSALAWPAGSEVLVSAVNIPGMIQILAHHNLVAVPLDLNPNTLSIEPGAITNLVGPRTKGVLVAHLFGSRVCLDEIAAIAQRHHLLLVEDAAQAYDGSAYRGHGGACVSMFSFGPIKTQTALGGGLLVVRDRKLLEEMRRIQASYPRRSRWSFLRRILLFAAIKALTYRGPYSCLDNLCRWLKWNRDDLLSRCVRGFSSKPLIPQLRQKPPIAMLRLLLRRLQTSNAKWIQLRRIRAHLIASQLNKKPPGANEPVHSHWMLPVESNQPQLLVDQLVQRGFDATQKGSSLIVVPAPLGHPVGKVSRARQLIERLVYLPLHPTLSKREVIRMCRLINDFGASRDRPV